MSARSSSRIGFFLPDLNFGGVERVMFQLAEAMANRGRSVDLVVARARGEAVAEVPEQVRLVDLGARRTFTSVLALASYLRRERPAAMVAAKDHANVVAVLAGELTRPREPVVVTVHSRPSDALARPERWTGRVVRAVMPWVYGRAAAVVAVSDGVADDLRSIDTRGRWRLRTIGNPVISDNLVTSGASRPQHVWFDETHADPVVVWCGRLSEEKDPVTAVRAFASLRTRGPAKLVIVGDGPLRRSVEVMSRNLGLGDDVDVLGYVREPAPYLAHADVLVLSSRREGLPTVLVEALALGTPVVSTDCESGPREILDNGALGRLVPVGDHEAMAAALAYTLAEPRPATPSDALRSFTVDFATGRYLDLFDEIGAA